MTELQDLDRPALENHARCLFLAAEQAQDAADCVRLDRELWETGLHLECLRLEEAHTRTHPTEDEQAALTAAGSTP